MNRHALRAVYIFGPALLMLVMALIQVHVIPLFSERPWRYQLVWALPPLGCVAAATWWLHRRSAGGWFLVWGPVLAIGGIVAVYLAANARGFLAMGSHDVFPGALIMVPTVVLLFGIAAVAVVVQILRR